MGSEPVYHSNEERLRAEVHALQTLNTDLRDEIVRLRIEAGECNTMRATIADLRDQVVELEAKLKTR